MLDKAFRLTMKSLTSEGLTDDEAKHLRELNAKYELVRYVYMEKMKHEGSGLTDFHFTPGDSFVNTPIIDIVNSLLKLNKDIKEGKVIPLDFNDALHRHNPPHSGKEKTTL